MDLDPGRALKNGKDDGYRGMVMEKKPGAWMVRVWEKRVFDQVSVRWVGELHK